MGSILKPFGKDLVIYGFGLAVSKGLVFFLIPILTRLFSPAEYGVLEMFSTISAILSLIMTMGLDSAQTYFFTEAKNTGSHKPETITASVLQLRIVIGLIIIAVVSLFSPIIVSFTFEEPVPASYLYLVMLSTFFSTLVLQSIEIFRLLYQPWRYVLLSTFQSLAGIGFILLLAVLFEMRLQGYFLGLLSANFIAVIIGWISTRKYQSWNKPETFFWKNLMKFGIPLLPAGLMIWIMQACDRWMILKMTGQYEVGIYAVGANFSMIILLFVEAFRRTFLPYSMDALHQEEGKRIIQKAALWYILAGSVFSVILAACSPLLVGFIADKEYYESWKIVGVLCWSTIFYGFYMISGLGIFKSKKTYLYIVVYGVGALLNIILNFALIPVSGIMGAAIATSLAILVSNMVSMVLSNRYFEIRWMWGWYALIITVSWLLIYFIINFY